MRKLSLLLILLITGLTGRAYAIEVEQQFKDSCTVLLTESAKSLSPSQEYMNAVNELKSIIAADPQSIWADDAQYIIAAFTTNPRQRAVELEKVLSDYPNISLESWSKEKLAFFLPKNVDEATVSFELCLAYKDLGETGKLKSLAEESIKKFPEKAQSFEKIIK